MTHGRLAPWIPLLIITVAGAVVVSVLDPQFATEYNIFVILQEASTLAIIGLAVMVVLAVGDISLAVGGIGSLGAVFFGWLVQVLALPVAVAVPATLILGVLLGLANGLIITRSGLSGFVVTLATGAALTGIALGVTKSVAFAAIPSEWTAFGQARFGFIPALALVTLAVAAITFVFFRSLPAGRRILAVGGNAEAARLAGISLRRELILSHMLSGGLAALVAVLYVARLGSATPDLGQDWILLSFAVPIIGGTALAGGRVSVPGALIAAIVLSTINNALILLNVSQYSVVFAQGVLILIALLAGKVGGFGLLRRKTMEVAR